jgi:hypothetical protein
MRDPDLQIVKADDENADARYDFILRITLQNPNAAEEEGTQAESETLAGTGGER